MPAVQGLKKPDPTPEEILAAAEPPLTLGSCVLRRADCASIVQDALLYFEGARYHLVAWCIMPNHVHVIFAPLGEHTLTDILHYWKSFTANKINALLGKKGAFWERESFNHAIRSYEDLERFRFYVEDNPVSAHLCAASKDWPCCSAGFQPANDSASCSAGFQPASSYVFIPAAEIPFVTPSSRGYLPRLHKDGATYFVTFRLADAVETHEAERAGKMPALQCGVPGKMPAVQQDPGVGVAGRMPAVQGIEIAGVPGLWKPFPVEYKRGVPKAGRCDEVQLCAQALCIEEMLNVAVPEGFLFYGRPRRRYPVVFDELLRRETEAVALRMHALFDVGKTPRMKYEKKCDNCSMLALCLPKVTASRRSARAYLADALEMEDQDGEL